MTAALQPPGDAEILELTPFWTSRPFDAAAQMEIDLAEDLRSEGYTVTGGH